MAKIPSRVTVITGYQEQVQPTINRFFEETIDLIKRITPHREGPDKFSINSGSITNGLDQVTDDRVTTLTYSGRVVATVIENRTDFNCVSYSFFRNVEDL
jgi:hypothetical protein